MSEPNNTSYWMQVVAHIADPKKRELAMGVLQQIQKDNPDPKPTDRIYGIFLLYEANGLYLMEFPKKFHEEVGSKLEIQLGRFNDLVQSAQRRQSLVAEGIDRAIGTVYQANETLDDTATKIQKMAVDTLKEVNVPGIAEHLTRELEAKCMTPFRTSVHELTKTREQIDQARKSVEDSINLWRKFNLTAMAVSIFIACTSICGILSWIGYTHNRDDYVLTMAEEIRRVRVGAIINGDVLEKLALWKVQLELVNWVDANNQPVEQGHVLALRPVEGAVAKEGIGALYFKDQRPPRDNADFLKWLDTHLNNSNPNSIIVPSH